MSMGLLSILLKLIEFHEKRRRLRRRPGAGAHAVCLRLRCHTINHYRCHRKPTVSSTPTLRLCLAMGRKPSMLLPRRRSSREGERQRESKQCMISEGGLSVTQYPTLAIYIVYAYATFYGCRHRNWRGRARVSGDDTRRESDVCERGRERRTVNEQQILSRRVEVDLDATKSLLPTHPTPNTNTTIA